MTNHRTLVAAITVTALIVGGLLIYMFIANRNPSKTTSSNFNSTPAWQQVFATAKDGKPDAHYWSYDLNPAIPTYNNEDQAYTNSEDNVRIEDGKLIIEARRQAYTYPEGNDRAYQLTSGRIVLRPQDKQVGENPYAFEYGKLVARLKMPEGKGTWAAFWLLSDNQINTAKLNPTTQDWEIPGFYKKDGEVDVEFYGKHPRYIENTVHTFNGPDGGIEADRHVSDASSAFHDYGIEVTPEDIRFSIDGEVYHSIPKTSEDIDDWPYGDGNKLYPILNLAMGGAGGGPIEGTGPWQLQAEWFKFYEYTGKR